MNTDTLSPTKNRDQWLLFAAAVAVYLPGFGWGLPYATQYDRIHGWATDAVTPLDPLVQFYNLMQGGPYEWIWYPLMHHALLVVVYSPYLLYLFATGQFSNPSAEFPFGLADAYTSLQVLEYLGKAVTLAMAAGTIVIAYRIAHTLWDRATARLAAVLFMLTYPMFYYSKTGNVDVPLLFWTALAILVFIQITYHGFSVRRAVWLGSFVAVATATKDSGWGSFALMPPILLVLDYRRSKQTGEPMSWKPYIFGPLACLVAYLIGTGMVIDPQRHIAHIVWMRQHALLPEQYHHPATLAGFAALLPEVLWHIAESIGPVTLVIATAGLIMAAMCTPHSLVAIAPPIGYALGFLALTRLSLLRYAIPLNFIACIFAAYALARGMRAPHLWQRRLSWSLVILVCAWQLILGADLTYQMINDSRYAAADWLDEHTQPGDVIATTATIAALPRTKPGIEHLSFHRVDDDAELIAQEQPDVIIVMPNWLAPKGALYPTTFPDHVYKALADGSLGYEKAAYFKTDSLVKRQILDYPTVNPPIEVFVRSKPLTGTGQSDGSIATPP